MTFSILRWFTFGLISLILSGCPLPSLFQPKTPETALETKLFARGLEEYLTTGDLTTLILLPQEYPQGAWRTKAEGIIELADKHQKRQRQLEQAEQNLLLCKDEKDLALCRKEKEALTQDNQLLESTLKRLKEVLIDTELHAK
jgi:hypothetical protein